MGVELDELAAWLVEDALDEAPVLVEHLDHKATAWKSQKMCAWRWDTFIPPPRMPRSTVAVDVVHCHGHGGGAADAGMVPQPEPAMASPTAMLHVFPDFLYVDCEGASHDLRVLNAIKEIETLGVRPRSWLLHR
uniref:Uncharacterized protein n=1 Tax=Oryza sativa subsp. japonica TaxID=39947 RepID=Q6Z0H5_ORYSJ|nr:hypothetical protein [Oryza sativa Japonica Group]BAD03631.1 hypothetical protein [Oryza sativa Japonica Group]